jgi:hypothetical protein
MAMLHRSLALARRGARLASATRALSTAAPFHYQELFHLEPDTTTPYKKLTSDYVSTIKVCWECGAVGGGGGIQGWLSLLTHRSTVWSS